MRTPHFDFLAQLAADPANGWSIGSFGAIGEFVRDAGEPCDTRQAGSGIEIVTPRGGMRIAPSQDLLPVAWDSLSSDGESWGHSLAFCVPQREMSSGVIHNLGRDRAALRASDTEDVLFDLGTAAGAVRMCVRSEDPRLTAALAAAEGHALMDVEGLVAEVVRAQPHRILLSPAGRLEIFQPIPPPDGHSPVGPHTHYLPRLAGMRRPHSANVPIPAGWQSAITVHPPSPWRTPLGERRPFDPAVDLAFAAILDRFAIAEDRRVDAEIRFAIDLGTGPDLAPWPTTRRGRTKARIVLRRLAARGDARVQSWRALRDRAQS